LIHETPDIYIVGGQKTFATRLVKEEDGCEERRKCRIVLVPGFAESGVMVLVNMRTLDVKTVKFAVQGMTG
jgi:DNA polymerase delta subunit 2